MSAVRHPSAPGDAGRRKYAPFPPAFLDELRARASLYEIVSNHVQWHAGKSNPARRDWWACCPFHHEKTPSFHVDDGKGFYYCFGCGAKGDAISFVMAVERLSYPQAVRRLAQQAGLPLPEYSPAAAAKEAEEEQRRARIRTVLDEAQAFFCAQLRRQSARAAQEHLRRRGVAPDLQEQFSLGFAPAGNQLLRHFAGGSFAQVDLLEAGLIGTGEADGKPYDRFRNRIIFPIHDARGGLIAFGGRALAGDAPAKYLNSPETALFHKRDTLYNLARARRPAQAAQAILLVEGYMDVIAMTRAGFAHVVAPLGTALGERQIDLLWRLAPEPVVCFDGDDAGIRAAERVMDLLLERLKPGHSMRFALLPKEQDPEDLLRQGGSEAMHRLLETACPLDEMLWQREAARSDWRTPERRARLQQRLHQLVGRIGDKRVRSFYQAAMRRRMSALFYGDGRAAPASLETRRSALAGGAGAASGRRVRLLLYLGIRFPVLAERYGEELGGMDIAEPEAAAARDMLLATIAEDGLPDSQALRQRLAEAGLGGVIEAFERANWSSPVIGDVLRLAGLTEAKAEELWRDAYALEKNAAARRRDIPDAASELASLPAEDGEESERETLHRLRALHEEAEKPGDAHGGA